MRKTNEERQTERSGQGQETSNPERRGQELSSSGGARKWKCVKVLRTGKSTNDPVLRVMFDGSQPDTIILHTAAENVGLRASRESQWLASEDKVPMFSSCKYTVSIVDWKGRM